MKKLLLLLLSLMLLSAAQAQVSVQPVPWRTSRVTIHAQDRDLIDLLKEFATSQSLPISISDQVRGTISGVFTDVETGRFLDVICESSGLVWFYDGTRLHIEPSDSVVSRVMAFTHLTKRKLEDALLSVGYASGPKGREVAVKTGARPGLLVLVGAPQFIRATEVLANDLESQETTEYSERTEVRTFRLKYATAADVTITAGDQTTVLPGVARSLSNLMIEKEGGGGGSGYASMATGPLQTTRNAMHPSLKGTGLSAQGGNPLVNAANAAEYGSGYAPGYGAAPAPAPRHQREENVPGSPMIVVDTRLNAVLVRDYAARMPLYEELIRMLDVPTRTVEITAAIVDIDENVGHDLGTELLGIGKKNENIYRVGFNADRGLFDPVDTQGQIPSFIEGSNLARGSGLNVTALFTGLGYEFLTRLRALEQDGKAQVVTSPSVLTMDNIQAVIRTDETVYVRVAGNMETDLFDVSTGVVFRVTPSVVDQPDGPAFRLNVEITDGSFLPNQAVDAIPGTRESSITTQALVPGSKTLLLGGYFVERKEKNYTGIPILSRIPIIKNIFSRQQRDHARAQRFFFITPRLVNASLEATPVPMDSPHVKNGEELKDSVVNNPVDDEDTHTLSRKMATESIRQRLPVLEVEKIVPPHPAPLPPPPPEAVTHVTTTDDKGKTVISTKPHDAPAADTKPKKRQQLSIPLFKK